MNYWLTEPAEDLLSIWDYTADRWSEKQVDRYIDTLGTRLAWLTKNAGLWIPRPEIGQRLFSYPEQSHVIVFWEQHGGIEILRVLHGKMDLKRQGRIDPDRAKPEAIRCT